jgi:hypothetical protein
MQSIGQRDGRLLSLREQLWGPRMSAVAPCPACHERLELQLNTRDLVAGDRPHADGSNLFELEGYAVTFRLPNSEDVAAAAHFASDADSCRELILENCVLTAQLRDAQISAKQLPPEVIAGMEESMANADPLADIQLALTCASCGESFSSPFDIVSYLWTEIEVWALRILSDVDTLARAYAWSERDILNLSPLRRQFYLERVGA